ncbi:MAG: hypothetical protein CMJ88_14050 [Planctomycetes bacterium]|nr:hypothetical protein [Planctomycetota bacterium]
MSSNRDTTDPDKLVKQAEPLGIKLAPAAAEEVLAFLDAMLVTNQQINLTAVRDQDAAVVLHALDSLAFQLADLRPLRALDLGTGNGFPGVGVAALFPQAQVTLMDKTGKKIRAIRGCLETAGMERVEAIQMDAKQAPGLERELRQGFDVCTARAVARPEVLAELAEPLVRAGGHLAVWLEEHAAVAEQMRSFRLHRQIRYQLPAPAERARQLVVWERR